MQITETISPLIPYTRRPKLRKKISKILYITLQRKKTKKNKNHILPIVYTLETVPQCTKSRLNSSASLTSNTENYESKAAERDNKIPLAGVRVYTT